MFKRILTMFAGGLLLALISGLFLFAHGVATRPSGRLETRIITAAKHWLLVGDKKLRNPLPVNEKNILEGQQDFSYYCYACHGLDGQGTGVPFADAMSPPIPSLSSSAVQTYSDGQLHWVIKNGLWPTGMPRANGILTDEEMWAIVLYIRHLPPAGSLQHPLAYSDKSCDDSSSDH